MQIASIRVFNLIKFLVLLTLIGGVLPAVGTAQEAEKSQSTQAPAPAKDDELERLRKSVRQLGAEVTRLRAENALLEKYRQVDYLRDLLVKDEQRLEALQKELVDMGAKEISLQKRLDEIESQLRPDRIEQSLAGVGSTKPEQERAAVENQLSNEKHRIQAQLDQFRQNRPRLQSSISSAEGSIVTLRQRLREAVRSARLPEK